MPDKYLFCLDIDGIQEYIFNTNRLKTIAGASSIIDRLNNQETVEKLKNKYGFNRTPKSSDNFIYSNGGTSKILFNSGDDAKAFEKEMHRMYAGFGISVTTHIEKVTGSEKKTLDQAAITLAQKKYNKSFLTMPVTLPYIKICECCGKEYAGNYKIKIPNKQEPLLVCRYCHKKAKEEIEKVRVLDELVFLKDIDKIKGRENMLALVVMDGNRMGHKIDKMLNRLSSEESAFSHLKDFSNDVESIIYQALLATMSDKKYKQNKTIDLIRPIIVGGDDVVFLIKAEAGLHFTIELIKKIKDSSASNNNFSGGIEMSAGILFMKHNYPFTIGYQIAASLLKSAKKGSVENDDKSMIDFHIMQSASADHISGIRNNEYTYYDESGNEYYLTQKPYTLDEIDTFRKNFEKMKSLLPSNNKLKKIRDIIRLGKFGSISEMFKIALKMRNKEFIEFYNEFISTMWSDPDGLSPITTGLLDMVEMSDLIVN